MSLFYIPKFKSYITPGRQLSNNNLSFYNCKLNRVFQKQCIIILTLQILPLALALIKTKNRHLFDPLVRKCSFYIRIQRFQWLETKLQPFFWKSEHFLLLGLNCLVLGHLAPSQKLKILFPFQLFLGYILSEYIKESGFDSSSHVDFFDLPVSRPVIGHLHSIHCSHWSKQKLQ